MEGPHPILTDECKQRSYRHADEGWLWSENSSANSREPRWARGEDDGLAAVGDVLLELPAILLELPDPPGNDIADRDDAGQLSCGEHRHVPDSQLGHGGADVVDRDVRPATDDGRRHQVGDRRREDVLAPLVELPDDVALGDDADDAVVVDDDQRADIVLCQPGE